LLWRLGPIFLLFIWVLLFVIVIVFILTGVAVALVPKGSRARLVCAGVCWWRCCIQLKNNGVKNNGVWVKIDGVWFRNGAWL
jgi:hypothetical protein